MPEKNILDLIFVGNVAVVFFADRQATNDSQAG